MTLRCRRFCCCGWRMKYHRLIILLLLFNLAIVIKAQVYGPSAPSIVAPAATSVTDINMLPLTMSVGLLFGNKSPLLPLISSTPFASFSNADRTKMLYPNGLPKSDIEAKKYLVEVTVPVWDKNGKSSTLTFCVHRALVGEVKVIFHEIYSAPEKPRIRTVLSYCWRVSTTNSAKMSHHSLGTALDLNPVENCQHVDKPLVGDHYTPAGHEDIWAYTGDIRPVVGDPLSFAPDGMVVKIFANHGWTWGQVWTTHDPMHFSLLGK